MRDIVCVSNSDWHPFPTRKQELMRRLSESRILYFNPPLTYAAPLKDESAKARMADWKKGADKIKDGLSVYDLPPVLPLYNKYRVINKINQRKLGAYIRRRMKEHGMTNPVLWLYPPFCADLVRHVPHSAVVYDCTDRHSAFKGLIDVNVVDGMEADLASGADIVFATARGLHETLSAGNKDCYLVPNGANYELFSMAQAGSREVLPFPTDLFQIKAPIIGFVGMLQECIEYSYLEAAASARPDWSFVLLGKPLPGVDVEFLRKYPNIHLLGLKPQKELPSYMAQFDVLINIFRAGELARDVSPLKFYEYLATGKPIVSTSQPLQVREYSDVVYIADSAEEFIARISEALSENHKWSVEQRVKYAKLTSWDARAAEIEALLKKHGI